MNLVCPLERPKILLASFLAFKTQFEKKNMKESYSYTNYSASFVLSLFLSAVGRMLPKLQDGFED